MIEAIAHRALVAAGVTGVLRVRAGIRVAVGSGAEGSETDVVVVDDVGDAAFAEARARISDDGVVVVTVRAPMTEALEAAAANAGALGARDDAYAHALRWAGARSGSRTSEANAFACAFAIDGEKLDAIVAAAGRSGLVLVEPDLATASPGLARVRGVKTAAARALFATIATGARARPLLFVPSAKAPKGGLARVKVERLTDGWVAAGASAIAERAAGADLTSAAISVLRDRARSASGSHESSGALSFKELLREARERWAAAARAAGRRVTHGTTDARELATALYRLAANERVTLYMLDPSAPGWNLATRAAQSPS